MSLHFLPSSPPLSDELLTYTQKRNLIVMFTVWPQNIAINGALSRTDSYKHLFKL